MSRDYGRHDYFCALSQWRAVGRRQKQRMRVSAEARRASKSTSIETCFGRRADIRQRGLRSGCESVQDDPRRFRYVSSDRGAWNLETGLRSSVYLRFWPLLQKKQLRAARIIGRLALCRISALPLVSCVVASYIRWCGYWCDLA